MLDSCQKHPHESGADLCSRCGRAWCSHCLVYAFGPKKPPYCMSCAMVAGGVRTESSIPAMPRKALKAQQKALRAEAKAEAKAAKEAARQEQVEEAVVAAYDGGANDWATPWWEDREPTLAD